MKSYTTEIYIDLDGQKLIKKTFSDGTIRFENINGRAHRLDGPAVIYSSGREVWYKDGQLHREDGPTIVYSDGTKFWYKDGQLHREDGPAEIWSYGTEYYYLEGKQYSKEGYYKKIDKSNEHKS